MVDVRSRLRALLEAAMPWFDREAETRWRVGFDRDIASSKAVRAHADAELGRQDLLRNSFSRASERLGR